MNINEMLKKAKRIQGEMEKDEQEIAKKQFLINKQGIDLTILGSRKITEIKINPALIDPDDPELLQDLIMLAVNEGLEEIEASYEEINSKYSGNGF
ncbi:YbaB/EbfC family nucleoid-associated protein [Metamycoplasma equirhinis]|uniref:Nucleoid-associated protein R9B83_02220 n=1 Tax=Metamycoplasma equirhinis TaxID=92402 RepID=A0ABZ0PAB7_9BACT|nr:YbaB/EbfC family nucleoid-associated protein [Metamycoplasma equirhinis]TPD99465.1 YbaB/EbfC family nucleoid-associated protein [Metamycoplasma equirhinis]WPB53786.1 YbaB/EbfC family nucleoid-associated protein [Metamycoplasma equirhinis]